MKLIPKYNKGAVVWVLLFNVARRGIVDKVQIDENEVRYDIRILDSEAETALTRAAKLKPCGMHLCYLPTKSVHKTKLAAENELRMRYEEAHDLMGAAIVDCQCHSDMAGYASKRLRELQKKLGGII